MPYLLRFPCRGRLPRKAFLDEPFGYAECVTFSNMPADAHTDKGDQGAADGPLLPNGKTAPCFAGCSVPERKLRCRLAADGRSYSVMSCKPQTIPMPEEESECGRSSA